MWVSRQARPHRKCGTGRAQRLQQLGRAANHRVAGHRRERVFPAKTLINLTRPEMQTDFLIVGGARSDDQRTSLAEMGYRVTLVERGAVGQEPRGPVAASLTVVFVGLQ